MKKILLASIFIVISILSLSGEQKEIAPFSILTPRTTGMGNANISMAKGFETLWTNPAGFTDKKGELNILCLNASILGNYNEMKALSGINTSSMKSMLDTLEPAITGKGIGTNAGAGISWVGKRIGIGLYDSMNVYLQGDEFPAGVEGYVDNTLSLMGGYSYPFFLTDNITLIAGLALRPSLKWRVEVDGALIQSVTADNGNQNAYFNSKAGNPAFGVPVDIGTRATFPYGLSAAITFKDIFATYYGSATDYQYFTHWSANAGGAWNPDLKDYKWLIDPTLAVEFSNINRIIESETGFWREFHIGMELVTLKKVLTIYAGLDGGYPALGATVDLFIVDLSLAYGTTEYGRYLGDRPVSNFTVEVSFRLD